MNRPVARFIALLAGCVLVAVLASPWIYTGVQFMAASKVHFAEYLSRYPFHRYFNRVLQLSVLITLPVFIYRTGFVSKTALGLHSTRGVRDVVLGLVSSLLIFSAFGVLLGFFGAYGFEDALGERSWGMILLRIVLTATFVSLFEEVFFRGYMYGLFKQTMSPGGATLVNALLFASVHYLKPARPEDIGSVHWDSGFRMLGLAFQRLGDVSEIAGGMAVLLAIAWMLCWSRDRTGSLYLAIGLHAGWIFALQAHGELTRPGNQGGVWILGGGDLSQGIVAVGPLLVQWLLLAWWLKRRSRAKD